MSNDQPQLSDQVYRLRVVLRDCSPMIWRRLLVTSDTSISQLHTVLQITMGWQDLHLHRFRIYGKEYGIYRDGGMFFDDNLFQVKLSDFKLRPGERLEYDMVDFCWQHDIRIEQVLPTSAAPLDTHKTYPVCVAGSGDCPPEDCGGPPGYRCLLEERATPGELWSKCARICSWWHSGAAAPRFL